MLIKKNDRAMNTQLALQEKDIELIVIEKTLGSLTTNAKQIRDIEVIGNIYDNPELLKLISR